MSKISLQTPEVYVTTFQSNSAPKLWNVFSANTYNIAQVQELIEKTLTQLGYTEFSGWKMLDIATIRMTMTSRHGFACSFTIEQTSVLGDFEESFTLTPAKS